MFFENQIIIFQIKSLYVIQLWFKSNHDLDLPTTEKYVLWNKVSVPLLRYRA